jgi:hypothetical protein
MGGAAVPIRSPRESANSAPREFVHHATLKNSQLSKPKRLTLQYRRPSSSFLGRMRDNRYRRVGQALSPANTTSIDPSPMNAHNANHHDISLYFQQLNPFARPLPPNLAGTQTPETPNEPSPIFGHSSLCVSASLRQIHSLRQVKFSAPWKPFAPANHPFPV